MCSSDNPQQISHYVDRQDACEVDPRLGDRLVSEATWHAADQGANHLGQSAPGPVQLSLITHFGSPVTGSSASLMGCHSVSGMITLPPARWSYGQKLVTA